LDVTGRYRYPPPNPAWLALSCEEVIDPAAPIIDAHHHLWVENGVPYLLPEIADDVADGHRVLATIFVQAHYAYRADLPPHLAPVGETEKVAAMAAEARRLGLETRIAAGIVAFADLTGGAELEAALDAHAEAADGALRGIRHSVSRDEHFPDGIVIRPAPRGLLADPAYRTGLAALARRGLSYDAMLYHSQLEELAAAARAVPDLPIVLDHAGCRLGIGPYEGRGDESFRAWASGMALLAACPNVFVKLGGFGMVICGARWHERPAPPSSAELAEAWRPAFETCLDLFGANRCLFESNFPVDKAMYSYRTLWNAFKRLAANLSDTERHALFAGTAARVYRLGLPANDPLLETADA
jgi:predicted TIM-barrel fold metal-dependent hydrolase